MREIDFGTSVQKMADFRSRVSYGALFNRFDAGGSEIAFDYGSSAFVLFVGCPYGRFEFLANYGFVFFDVG